MSEGTPGNAAGNGEESSSSGSMISSVLRVVVIFVVFNKLFAPQQAQQPPAHGGVQSTTQSNAPSPNNNMHRPKQVYQEYGIQKVENFYKDPETMPLHYVVNPFQGVAVVHPQSKRLLPHHTNLFMPNTRLAMRAYLSPLDRLPLNTFHTDDELVWEEENLYYSNEDDDELNERIVEKNISIPTFLASNATVYAHVYVFNAKASPDPTSELFNPRQVKHNIMQLTTYRAPVKKVAKRNLLSKDEPEEETKEVQVQEETEEDAKYRVFWKPEIRVNMVVDSMEFERGKPPLPYVSPYLDVDLKSGNYLPVLYLNEFWILEEHLVQVNKTTTKLPLKLHYYPISITKFFMYNEMSKGFLNQKRTGLSEGKDNDVFKRMVMDTNPYLLAVTFFVSILHTLFDMLAFKNDVNFWRKKKSMEGLSLRTVLVNCFFQLVIFLYLVDNDTSWMILMSSGLGLLIEFWKIKKVIVVSRDPTTNKLSVRGVDSYAKSETAKYDAIAVEHLSYLIYPLVVGYSAYALMYGEHKGWYSWILSSLVGFVYAFGFILMTPQLYINYRMKSVAHLPWRAMVYKSLNTFIDDLFAFVITMPWMHRLACFRDDLIFFIYLYQKWIYPVDKKRVNEFGQVAEPEEEEAQDKSEPQATEPQEPDDDAASLTEKVTDAASTTGVTRRSKRSKFPKE